MELYYAPPGRGYDNKIIFHKVVKPELIACPHMVNPQFEVSVTFEKYGDKTRLIMAMTFENEKDYSMAMNQIGVRKGWSRLLGGLKYISKKI